MLSFIDTYVASGCLLLTSLVGLTGTLLNSRPLLAFYNILLWPSLISTATIGYASYKHRTYNLDGKMNEGWSRNWDDLGRLVIQNSVRMPRTLQRFSFFHLHFCNHMLLRKEGMPAQDLGFT